MALIRCSECGKQISDKADVCPTCGNPIQVYFDIDSYDVISNYEIKKCTRCGRDIPKKVGKCPYCGKNQSIVGGIIGIIIILIFLSKFLM